MSTIEAIQKENVELRRIVENHAFELERIRGVVYQLLGGLFNQKTQHSIQQLHIDILHRKKYEDEDVNDEAEDEDINDEAEEEVCSTWPTTRQGDKHEERLRKMEEIMKNIEERVLSIENKMM